MKGMILGFISGITVFIIGIVLGTKRVRAQRGGGEFTYGQAYLAGLSIALFAGLSGLLFNFIFFKFLIPDFGTTQAEWMRSLMEKMNAPPDKVEEAIEKMKASSTIGRYLLNGLISSVIMGALVSLLTAAFLKRAPSDEPPVAG
jgi:Protein of unknown function (DUF4199)/Predicted membrane protein (DUF2232)